MFNNIGNALNKLGGTMNLLAIEKLDGGTYNVDSILSAKYVFFLNASSNELPRLKVKSELDLRNYDITEKEKMENAFFIQYQNAFKFYISYVDKDLKTDEDFFKSSFVKIVAVRVSLIII